MKNRIVIIALAALFSLGLISTSYASEGKPAVNKSHNCNKEAKMMKFNSKKEKNAFVKECKNGKAKKESK